MNKGITGRTQLIQRISVPHVLLTVWWCWELPNRNKCILLPRRETQELKIHLVIESQSTDCFWNEKQESVRTNLVGFSAQIVLIGFKWCYEPRLLMLHKSNVCVQEAKAYSFQNFNEISAMYQPPRVLIRQPQRPGRIFLDSSRCSIILLLPDEPPVWLPVFWSS